MEDIKQRRLESTRVISTKNRTVNLADKKKNEWDTGTILIMGDSMSLGLQEKKLGSKVKVRGFSDARINNSYNYLIPLLEKRPTRIILMVGTNDAVEKSSEEILTELLSLKKWIRDKLPGINLTLSCPPIRNDNQKSRLTI